MKMRRSRISMRRSKRMFTRTAARVHKFNVPSISRGGIRF